MSRIKLFINTVVTATDNIGNIIFSTPWFSQQITPCEVLLGPAVGFLTNLWRWPSTIPMLSESESLWHRHQNPHNNHHHSYHCHHNPPHHQHHRVTRKLIQHLAILPERDSAIDSVPPKFYKLFNSAYMSLINHLFVPLFTLCHSDDLQRLMSGFVQSWTGPPSFAS